MKSKFELSISTNYVPDWGITEAFRELFQNAIDNETVNPENKMSWNYDGETVTIANKTSKLNAESLLLGSGTKADDDRTIGKHGEGYKIAFMVLLRNNKKITVYNYGAREIWEVRLVKSKRYNGQLITTVFIEKEAKWKNVPSSDLIIEVTGVKPDEYMEIVDKNLHLRTEPLDKFKLNDVGEILLDSTEAGNIYVSGLFVTKEDKLKYGYNFDPKVLSLDRDRRMVNTFNVQWEASKLWICAAKENESLMGRAIELVNNESFDTQYIQSISSLGTTLIDKIAEDFYDEHGVDAVPVTNNSDYKMVERSNEGKPVIVSERKAEILKNSSVVKEHVTIEKISLQSKFRDFLDRIVDRLSDEEIEEFEELIEQVDY